MSDPPGASIFDVVDKINLSEGADGVSKEAAQALRKKFKHGNEAERRAAAKVWLITMRNISTRSFRGEPLQVNQIMSDVLEVHAASKKFLSSLEALLLAPPSKPLLSTPTHKFITDILADLTYMYGTEKGCEALVELWRKVKMPQEPDLVSPVALIDILLRLV